MNVGDQVRVVGTSLRKGFWATILEIGPEEHVSVRHHDRGGQYMVKVTDLRFAKKAKRVKKVTEGGKPKLVGSWSNNVKKVRT
jgi:hypothetical protein